MIKAVKKSFNARDFDLEKSGLNQENLDLFFNMIYDRQMIWKRRFIDKSSAPWTDNEVFLKYKFCNVYREHDRSSQWEIRNIIMDDSLSDKNLIWKILVYRTFNNPETFARAIDKWPNGIPDYDTYDEDEFAEHIEEIKSLGLNPFTSAYSITGNISVGSSINDAFCHIVIPTIHKSIDAVCSILNIAINPEQIITFLMTLPSVSAFIAHEFYQDFTYISLYTDRTIMKFGQNDYTNLGPGSSQGVRLIFPKLRSTEQISCYSYLQSIADEKLEEIGLEKGELMPYAQWNRETKKYDIIYSSNLSLNQIEGALCEFSKYVRILNHIGRPRCPEFIPRTSSVIVERTDTNQEEFLSDSDDFLSGKHIARRTKPLANFSTTCGKRGRKKGSTNKKSDFSIDLNLNLNLLNAEQLINKLIN